MTDAHRSNEAINRTTETVVAWRICRQSLPPYALRVLVSMHHKTNTDSFVTIASRESTDRTGEHWKDSHSNDLHHAYEVRAWAPLPKPSVEQ